MTASSKTLENKNDMASIEGVPHDLFNNSSGLNGVRNIIYEEWFDVNNPHPSYLNQPFTFFGISSLQKQILSLAYHAAPLEEVEAYVKKAHAKGEEHLSETLQKAIIQAIHDLDITIRDEKGVEIAEGMAEKLTKLHETLFPGKHSEMLKQVSMVVVLPNEKDKAKQESLNEAAVNQVFDAIKAHDHSLSAIQTFKELVKNTTLVNRIHLLYVAFDVLARRGDELSGKRFGKLGDQFCFEIIGAAIEKNLPARMQQLLKTGLYYVLNRGKKVERKVDIEERDFMGSPGSDCALRINSYYDDIAANVTESADVRGMGGYGAGGLQCGWIFKTYYEQLHQLPKFITQRQQAHPTNERMPNPYV